MDKHLKAHIEYLLCVKITSLKPVSGGDISEAYLIETESERFFCKLNFGKDAQSMFIAEKSGLEAIAQTKTLSVPKVLLCEPLDIGGLLIMEYADPKSATSKDMKVLGHQLGSLHQLSNSRDFGWEIDNFIGSLPQSNRKNTDWTNFYIEERLLPQLQLAVNKDLLSTEEIPLRERLVKACRNLFPTIKPSLLHGDLWGGNYLISTNGNPYLIDPAVYYGHYEVDIAMTRLFGGFSASFYDAYSEIFPSEEGEKERMEIYQLYYLLVHLNLFGLSYKGRVSSILKRYF